VEPAPKCSGPDPSYFFAIGIRIKERYDGKKGNLRVSKNVQLVIIMSLLCMIPPVGTGTVPYSVLGWIFRYLPFLGHDTLLHNLSGTVPVLAAFLQFGESVLWIRITECGSGTGSGPSTFSHCGSGFIFLPPWIRIRIQLTKVNTDPCESGPTTLPPRAWMQYNARDNCSFALGCKVRSAL
jgi:hypothetical protein